MSSTIIWKRRYRNDLLDKLVNDTTYRIKIAGGIIAAVLVIWVIYSIATYRRTERFSVAHIGWETQIGVQQYQTVHEGDWSVPNGGRETDHYRKQRSTETYVSGHRTRTIKGTCTTTGSGKNQRRSCSADRTVTEAVYSTRPVYDTYYEYDIDRWLSIQPLTASGDQNTNKAGGRDTHEWYWPDTSDTTYIDSPVIGNKRLGLRQTHFFIVFVNDNPESKIKQSPADMPEERWKTHHMGGKYDITFGWFNNVLEINKAGAW